MLMNFPMTKLSGKFSDLMLTIKRGLTLYLNVGLEKMIVITI